MHNPLVNFPSKPQINLLNNTQFIIYYFLSSTPLNQFVKSKPTAADLNSCRYPCCWPHLHPEKFSKLKTKEKNHLYEALQKIKDELMLLGFVSLLLAVLQDEISSICIPQKFVMKWIPCNAENVQISTLSHRRRRLLAQEDGTSSCPKMGSSYNAEAMKRLDSQASNRTDDRIPERTNNTDASVEMANQPRGQ